MCQWVPGGTPPMSRNISVAAVVVTFNRKTLLAECLDALLCQNRPLDHVFIVDQASTDGTGHMLQAQGYLQRGAITYSRSEKNTGGAGGFKRGVEMAYSSGFDWIWLMDDDAIAKPDALDTMLRYTLVPQTIGIANAKIRRDGTLDTGHFVYEKGSSPGSQPAYLTFSSFVGLMVSNAAVKAIGFPKAELFLQGDDTEYCIRLCEAGRIVFAQDSVLVHKEVSRPPELIRRFGRDFTIYPKDRFCFQYFLWRNRVWIELYARGFRPDRIAWLASKFLRVVLRTCLVDRIDLPFRLFILLRALMDGVLGRFDNEFPFRMRDRLIPSSDREPRPADFQVNPEGK
jgi:rhamnopyranosyl-N-acetylglucosaminyl-diphospho-decaprenol beta-1,3/1,4-galactofuranosyltransferase